MNGGWAIVQVEEVGRDQIMRDERHRRAGHELVVVGGDIGLELGKLPAELHTRYGGCVS